MRPSNSIGESVRRSVCLLTPALYLRQVRKSFPRTLRPSLCHTAYWLLQGRCTTFRVFVKKPLIFVLLFLLVPRQTLRVRLTRTLICSRGFVARQSGSQNDTQQFASPCLKRRPAAILFQSRRSVFITVLLFFIFRSEKSQT